MMTTPSLLIVEDDQAFAERLKKNLELAHYTVRVVSSAEDALEELRARSYDAVVTDIRLPQMSGLDLLRRCKQGETGIDPDVPFIVLTSVNSVDVAVEAMKIGAEDYITKEAERQEIVLRIRKVLDQSKLVQENRLLRDQLAQHDEFRELVGESPQLRAIKEEIAQIAGSNVNVLITGETGVGKELVARAIHRTSPHAKGPFIDVNCAALPDDNLFQSEVFGHEKGAFTDATYLRKGKFELASGGTLFLDEIAELSRESQAKILKALEQQTITRLGGMRPIRIDCRFIFATNKDLWKEVQEGRFRDDLYYRIAVFIINVPPLRERKSDIPLLAKFFADQFARKYNKPPMFFEEGAMALLREYSYPGNIRELRNIIERLVIRAKDDVITRAQVESVGLMQAPVSAPSTPAPISLPEEGIALEEVERQLVVEALNRTGWNQKEAAALLRISVDRMHSRIKKYGLKHPAWRVHK
ncbi:MAG: sigma-54-dependent Fis family transcriptional regulator [Candidatus Hydrogenedentota bacterium]|jgi:two-component system NtrC family response regulator|nr:MAG: sigma-54-dependent Fis family transcriptional regulator [Candidatus Hydrogenedentota bacterium]GIX44874.1 MAG: acetoacetate metabolism regulatory protein AtoC [Candidatus Sumerlaea sp.]